MDYVGIFGSGCCDYGILKQKDSWSFLRFRGRRRAFKASPKVPLQNPLLISYLKPLDLSFERKEKENTTSKTSSVKRIYAYECKPFS